MGFPTKWELAGGILNILPLVQNQVVLYVIDVSGHGVAAALFAVTLSRLLSATPRESSLFTPDDKVPSGQRIATPVQVAEKLNGQFPFGCRTGQYFTMCMESLTWKLGSSATYRLAIQGLSMHHTKSSPRISP